MALNLPVFYQRTGSAIVFAAVMLVGLLWNLESFYVLMTVISVLCLKELMQLLQKINPETHWPKWLPANIMAINVLVIVYTFFLRAGSICGYNAPAIALAIICYIVILTVFCILPEKNALAALMQGLGSLFYVTCPFLALISMRWMNYELPLALILMIWTNDTMAYLVGSFIGKTPFSAISPKKTWEGTGGGAILTMIGAMAYGYLSHKYSLVDWAALALCAGVAGTLGDLVESKLKRMANVKDSGTLMPGHGGAFDRFDSLLLAAPFAGCYVALFM